MSVTGWPRVVQGDLPPLRHPVDASVDARIARHSSAGCSNNLSACMATHRCNPSESWLRRYLAPRWIGLYYSRHTCALSSSRVGQNVAHLDQNTGASWGYSGLLDITVPRASLGLL